MRAVLTRWFTRLNAFLIRISRGRVGGRLGTQSILLLHTTGRRSGQPRSTPVAYFEREGKYLLVGSNWGRPHDADWVLNLRHDPHGRIDVNGRSFAVMAHEADGEEYLRLWQHVTGRHAPYIRYQSMVSRRIPLVVLERAPQPGRVETARANPR